MKHNEKNWLVELIGVGVMLACVLMLVAAAHVDAASSVRVMGLPPPPGLTAEPAAPKGTHP
jgi:hypothetical protein